MSIRPSELAMRLWAKTEPFHPLLCHMIDAGRVAQTVVRCNPMIARTLGEAMGRSDCEGLAPWLGYLVAMHDIGKCHPDFQGKGPTDVVSALQASGIECTRHDPKYRHEGLSARWFMDYLMDSAFWARREASTVSAVMRGHHGNYRTDDPPAASSQARWEPLRWELEGLIRGVFRPEPWLPSFRDHDVAGLLLSGLTVLSDWIASTEELFPRSSPESGLANYERRSAELAYQAVSLLGLAGSHTWRAAMPFRAVWPQEQFSQPRPLQVRCEELTRSGLQPGLAIIEAPMGEGKTEAALYLATDWAARRGLSGMYIALPTAATSNQMHGRVQAFLKRHDPASGASVRLVHGMAWLIGGDVPERAPEIDDESSKARLDALDWFRPKKRSLLAPYAVGTVDQALMSVMHVRHGFLRLFGLANKVLVIDEVHAYDAYMTRIIDLMLQWCAALGVPVILLSATLPGSRRRSLIEAYGGSKTNACADSVAPLSTQYPLLTFVGPENDIRQEPVTAQPERALRVQLVKHHCLLDDHERVASAAYTFSAHGGCVAVILNTVGSAQRVFTCLKTMLGAQQESHRPELILFHARFPAARRHELENSVLSMFDRRSLLPQDNPEYRPRPDRAILVATQVVEQSLDLDFDELVSEIAPMDLLLQRIGRLHRHRRASRPTGTQARVHLLLPDSAENRFGPSESVYHRFILLKTLLSVGPLDFADIPADIRRLVEEVYGEDLPGNLPSSGVTLEDLDRSLADWRARCALESSQAERYLIPHPNPIAFGLARLVGGAFDEADEGATSYFAARTRLGNHTRPVLFLEAGPESPISSLLKQSHPPNRASFARIVSLKADIPRWWLRDVQPEGGYAAIEEAPEWLPDTVVVNTIRNRWYGRDRAGNTIAIHNDPELGVHRLSEGRE